MSLNLNTQVSLGEFADLIAAVGRDVSIIGRGEPGIGKSAVFHDLAARPQFADYAPLYLDCTMLDMGDLQIPVVSEGRFAFTPNAMFTDEKPMLIMLDELGKAPRTVQNALLPLVNGEKRIGNFKLRPDTVVFATTNLTTDGVGDSIQAHALNRICAMQVAKPDADAWSAWAMGHEVDPAVIAWAKHYPHAFASYTDTGFDQDNPYVYNPRKQQTAFVTPRSMEKSSHIAKQRHNLPPQAFIVALAGTVGEAAARDMSAFMALGDALPDWGRVISTPDTCPVPEDTIAQTILALGAVQRLDKPAVTPWLNYMARLHKEAQAMFVAQAMASSKTSLLVTHPTFTRWAVDNNYLY